MPDTQSICVLATGCNTEGSGAPEVSSTPVPPSLHVRGRELVVCFSRSHVHTYMRVLQSGGTSDTTVGPRPRARSDLLTFAVDLILQMIVYDLKTEISTSAKVF